MHVRVVSARSGQEVRRYAQLVRSYRGADGVPRHEVIAGLGSLSDQEVENLRRALRASRQGQSVVLPSETKTEDWQLKVIANLDYLDAAVALSMWDSWKLTELLNRLLPRGSEHVATSAIVAPLVLQRCLAPGSKALAQRWLRTTALPELLGLDPDHFNNGRIHRALDDLDRVNGELQAELPKRYEHRDGAFAALFLDVTDTWFHGHGPELAQRDRTKEGLRNVHKIGIVLLCNEHGYPMRWDVVAGKRRDPQCMEAMVETVERLDWVRQVPFVCDRAMGHASAVARLAASGLRFLTATRVSEIPAYTEDLPTAAFADLTPTDTELSLEIDIAAARAAAEGAGLERVDDFLYVKDLGVRARTLHVECEPIRPTGAEHDPASLEGGAAFLALARILRRKIETGEAKSQAALAREHELTRARITQLFNLLRLDFKLQERLLRGDFGYVSERVLRDAVRRKGAEAQKEVIERAAVKREDPGRPFRRTGPREVALRLVAYFNPQLFVENRARALVRRAKLATYVAELNQRLPSLKRTRETVYRDVMNKLTGNNVVSLYSVHIDSVDVEPGRTYFQVRLELDEKQWERRRRFDGFVLLIAHPELPMTGAELARLFRAKDAVEKDFQTIKSVIKLRPVFHHTDPKVRAHVTLCMLGLLVERTLEKRLRKSATPLTASACFEQLRGCHLNILRAAPEAPIQYRLTQPTQDHLAVLRSLRLTELVDEEAIRNSLHPRDPP